MDAYQAVEYGIIDEVIPTASAIIDDTSKNGAESLIKAADIRA